MTHIEQLTQLRHDLIQECLNHFTLKQITLIKFKTPFIISIAEDNSFNDDSSLNDYKAQHLTSDGELTGEGLSTFEYGSNWNLNDMELMDIAYTLDQLEAGNYSEEDEIFLDENDQIGNDNV
ncbi:MAG: hypothetical protein WCP55_09715 [Lentisphaerota bacterium]